MGDSFFKIFFAGCFLLLFAAGAIMLYSMEQETVDELQVQKFISSRGKAPLPRAWRGQVGDGI